MRGMGLKVGEIRSARAAQRRKQVFAVEPERAKTDRTSGSKPAKTPDRITKRSETRSTAESLSNPAKLTRSQPATQGRG